MILYMQMTRSVVTPSYINSNGILFQQDCMKVMSEILPDSIDCIFADPPFNLKKKYLDTNYADNLLEHKYEEWTRNWLYESIRILKPGGSLFVYHIPLRLISIASILNSHPSMLFRHWIALNMKNGFPIKNRLHPSHYGLLYYVKKGNEFTFNVVRTQTPKCRHCNKEIKDYGGYREKFKKWEDETGTPWISISDFWEDTRPVRHDKKRALSVNELPYEIPERAILMSTNENDIVFDPFGGSGSTYFAAQLHKRFWIGSEKGNTDYIIKRLLGLRNHFNRKPPSKLLRSFRNRKNADLFVMTQKRQSELVIISSMVARETKASSDSNERYSHRMTNRIFDN